MEDSCQLAHQWRCGYMKNNMHQNMAMGTNNYPNSLEETMIIMNTHQQTKTFYVKGSSKDINSSTELMFMQKGSGRKEVSDITNIICSHCGEKCHYVKTWPKKGGQVQTIISEGWENEEDDNAKYTYNQTNQKAIGC